jgi:glycosyltransferase involved in cell wall biosynthesis
MQTNSPIITIGLPVYNGENHIEEAIQSVLSQTNTDFKLIISDNCSTDNTEVIAKKFLNKDCRISYYRQSENVGGLKNMLFLTQNISTPYFMWFAHDDTMEPRFLETCIKALDTRPEIDMAFTAIRNIDINGESIREYPEFHKLPFNSNLLTLIKYIFSAEYDGKANVIYSIYRSNIIFKAFQEDRHQLESPFGDICFLFSILASGKNAYIAQEILFNKRAFQEPNQIGHKLLVPKSYFDRSPSPPVFYSQKKHFNNAIRKYNRSCILSIAFEIRYLYLLTPILNRRLRHHLNLSISRIALQIKKIRDQAMQLLLHVGHKVPGLRKLYRYILKK